MDAFERRVQSALLSAAARSLGRSAVAVVTHGGPIRMVLHLLAAGRLSLASDATPPTVAPIANASILHLVPEGGGPNGVTWRVLAVNDVAHLEGLVTDIDPG